MRMVTVAAMVAAVLLAVTTAGCLTPLTSREPLRPVPVPARPLVGVYEPSATGSWSDVARFTGATGVKPEIVLYYSAWKDPFAASFAQTAWDHGAYVLVQLEPKGVTLASIAAAARTITCAPTRMPSSRSAIR